MINKQIHENSFHVALKSENMSVTLTVVKKNFACFLAIQHRESTESEDSDIVTFPISSIGAFGMVKRYAPELREKFTEWFKDSK